MRPPDEQTNRAPTDSRSQGAARVAISALAAIVMLSVAHVVTEGGPSGPIPVQAAPSSSTTTTPPPDTTTTPVTTPPTTQAQEAPVLEARYEVPPDEAAPEAKQLAVDIAYTLTTYDADDDHMERLEELDSRSGAARLFQASAPLIRDDSWSRGEVIYPQLGGLRNERASVMVVTRQTVGSGSEADLSVVRTLDIRLVVGESGWEFDFLDSAGGTFDNVEDLTDAHAVADNPRIDMPDSARLDILNGLASPALLDMMADLAEQTPYEIAVLATGHPRNVFETDRQSHHTIGQAVDIIRIGDDLVVDDRGSDSATREIVEWLYDHPDVHQVGSPWDLDGSDGRSFTDAVHQDHIHLAVDS